MSELIKREDLENWLRTECYGTDTDEDKESVIERLRNELPAASPWHRVEEELPDKTTTVLVWVCVNYDGMGMYPEMRTALWHTVSKHFFVHHDESIRGPIIGNVTHWMPLPEPPKEEA